MNNDRIHRIIFRLQTIVSVFLIEGLDRRRIIYQSDDHIPVCGLILLLHEHDISVQYAGIDHTFTVHLQHKQILVRKIFSGNREIVLDIFDGKKRLTCRHGSDDRYINDLAPRHIEIVIDNLDRTGLCRIAVNVAVLLKRVEMSVYR